MDSDSWSAALKDPAGHAAYIVAIAGDAVSKAVAEHPDGLQELSILCTTGQPCARTYQSTTYGTLPKSNSVSPTSPNALRHEFDRTGCAGDEVNFLRGRGATIAAKPP